MVMGKGFGSGGGLIGEFFKNPAAAIVALVFLFIGAEFLSSAIASGGILDSFMNSIEALLNATGLTTLATFFEAGGAAYLLIGAFVIAGALAVLISGYKKGRR